MDVIVLSSGRSATGTLAEILRCNGYDAVHEPVPSMRSAHHRAAQGDATYVIGELATTREAMPNVEVNPYLSLHGTQIRTAHPNVAIVHLHRDGRDAVTSHMRNGPDHLADTYGGDTPFKGACRWWARTTQAIENVDPDERVAFEEIVHGGVLTSNAVTRIARHIDEDPDPPDVTRIRPVNATPPRHASRFPDPDDWNDHQRKMFETTCRDAMQLVGRSLPGDHA